MRQLFLFGLLVILTGIHTKVHAARGLPTIKVEAQDYIARHPEEFAKSYMTASQEMFNVSKAENNRAIATLFRNHGYGENMSGMSDAEIAEFAYVNSIVVTFNEIGFSPGRYRNSYVRNGQVLFESNLEESTNYTTASYRKFIGDGSQSLIWAKVGCENLEDDMFDQPESAPAPSLDAGIDVPDNSGYAVSRQAGGDVYVFVENNANNSNTVSYDAPQASVPPAQIYPTIVQSQPIQQQVCYQEPVYYQQPRRWDCSFPNYPQWYAGAQVDFRWGNNGGGVRNTQSGNNYNFNYQNSNTATGNGGNSGYPHGMQVPHGLPQVHMVGGPGGDPTGGTGGGGGPGVDPTGGSGGGGGPGPDPSGGRYGRSVGSSTGGWRK